MSVLLQADEGLMTRGVGRAEMMNSLVRYYTLPPVYNPVTNWTEKIG
jgi:hypothetical protein